MTNAEMIARSLAHVWHPCTQMKSHERFPLVPIARGEGAWLIDFEGRRYLDGVSSWWVNLFGHAHPAINRAIAEQLGELEHVMLAGFTHAPAIELAERLAKAAPRGLGHAFFASDGASATEIALKMAAHYWANRGKPAKTRFVALDGGYHGETLGALGVSDVPIFRDAYAPLVHDALIAPFPARSLDDHRFGGMQGAVHAAEALARLLDAHAGTIAALIVEPLVQGASGMRFHHPEYLRRARELCTRHEVLLIADEIMTGFGRTGTMFACEQAAIAPDLMCLSKGITGGYLPLSCVLSTDAVYQAFYDDDVARGFLHSHSYTGNPLACRAALATLELFERTEALARNRALARELDEAFEPLARHPRVRHARRTGMIWAWDIDDAPPRFARDYFREAMARGLLLRPIGNTLYAMPPYVLDAEAVEHLGRAAATALEATLARQVA